MYLVLAARCLLHMTFPIRLKTMENQCQLSFADLSVHSRLLMVQSPETAFLYGQLQEDLDPSPSHEGREKGLACQTSMHNEHVDDILLHTQIHTYIHRYNKFAHISSVYDPLCTFIQKQRQHTTLL